MVEHHERGPSVLNGRHGLRGDVIGKFRTVVKFLLSKFAAEVRHIFAVDKGNSAAHGIGIFRRMVEFVLVGVEHGDVGHLAFGITAVNVYRDRHRQLRALLVGVGVEVEVIVVAFHHLCSGRAVHVVFRTGDTEDCDAVDSGVFAVVGVDKVAACAGFGAHVGNPVLRRIGIELIAVDIVLGHDIAVGTPPCVAEEPLAALFGICHIVAVLVHDVEEGEMVHAGGIFVVAEIESAGGEFVGHIGIYLYAVAGGVAQVHVEHVGVGCTSLDGSIAPCSLFIALVFVDIGESEVVGGAVDIVRD